MRTLLLNVPGRCSGATSGMKGRHALSCVESVQAAFPTSLGTSPQCSGPRNSPVRLATFSSPKGRLIHTLGVMKTLVSKDGYSSATAQTILHIRPIRVWMSKFFFFAITALVRCSLSASHAQPIQVPMSPGHFDTGPSMARFSAAAPQFGEFLGSNAIYLPSG